MPTSLSSSFPGVSELTPPTPSSPPRPSFTSLSLTPFLPPPPPPPPPNPEKSADGDIGLKGGEDREDDGAVESGRGFDERLAKAAAVDEDAGGDGDGDA